MAGGYGAGDPPDPIPNSEVKTRCADGTAGATRWDRTAPPAYYQKRPLRSLRVIGAGVSRFPPASLTALHAKERKSEGAKTLSPFQSFLAGTLRYRNGVFAPSPRRSFACNAVMQLPRNPRSVAFSA